MTDIPDWKKAIDRGTSMHTILAEKKSAEGPDWMKTPEEEKMLWEVRKFAVETYGKTKWAQTESKQQMESISSMNTIAGEFSAASSKISRSCFSDSP